MESQVAYFQTNFFNITNDVRDTPASTEFGILVLAGVTFLTLPLSYCAKMYKVARWQNLLLTLLTLSLDLTLLEIIRLLGGRACYLHFLAL